MISRAPSHPRVVCSSAPRWMDRSVDLPHHCPLECSLRLHPGNSHPSPVLDLLFPESHVCLSFSLLFYFDISSGCFLERKINFGMLCVWDCLRSSLNLTFCLDVEFSTGKVSFRVVKAWLQFLPTFRFALRKSGAVLIINASRDLFILTAMEALKTSPLSLLLRDFMVK